MQTVIQYCNWLREDYSKSQVQHHILLENVVHIKACLLKLSWFASSTVGGQILPDMPVNVVQMTVSELMDMPYTASAKTLVSSSA